MSWPSPRSTSPELTPQHAAPGEGHVPERLADRTVLIERVDSPLFSGNAQLVHPGRDGPSAPTRYPDSHAFSSVRPVSANRAVTRARR